MEEKRRNYEFYEARTSHESSLSPSLHSILAAELGKLEEAYQFTAYAARLDLDNYNRNTEQGIHSSSAAGVWGEHGLRFRRVADRRGDAHLQSEPFRRGGTPMPSGFFTAGALLAVSVSLTRSYSEVVEGNSVTVSIYGHLRQVTAEGLEVVIPR